MDTPSLPSGAESVERSAWLTTPVAILVGALLISGSVLYSGGAGAGTADLLKAAGQPVAAVSQQPSAPTDAKALVGDKSASIGNLNAPVTIVEFSDFQCPFCRSFWSDTYGQLKKEYIDTGKARLVFRNFPLSFHPASHVSALAGACALEQGKFWEFHDKIFSEQAKQGQGTVTYGASEIKLWAQQIGLNSKQFNSCLDSSKYATQIDTDVQAATDAGVNGTPTFFINGSTLVGAQPFSQFKQTIDAALK